MRQNYKDSPEFDPRLAAIPFNELFQKIEPPAMMVFA
jgi:hypothetical protein